MTICLAFKDYRLVSWTGTVGEGADGSGSLGVKSDEKFVEAYTAKAATASDILNIVCPIETSYLRGQAPVGTT